MKQNCKCSFTEIIKELANKKTKFECKILNVKESIENNIDDNFTKLMGAKDLRI